MRELQDWVAVVAGGASGIGRALARRFVADGMRVVLADVEAANRWRRRWRSSRRAAPTVVGVQADVAVAADVEAVSDRALGGVRCRPRRSATARGRRWRRHRRRALAAWEGDDRRQPDGRRPRCAHLPPLLARADRTRATSSYCVAGRPRWRRGTGHLLHDEVRGGRAERVVAPRPAGVASNVGVSVGSSGFRADAHRRVEPQRAAVGRRLDGDARREGDGRPSAGRALGADAR